MNLQEAQKQAREKYFRMFSFEDKLHDKGMKEETILSKLMNDADNFKQYSLLKDVPLTTSDCSAPKDPEVKLQVNGTACIGAIPAIAEGARETAELNDIANYMWSIICNVSGGDLSKQSNDWLSAFGKCRELYFTYLSKNTTKEQEVKG